MRLKRRKWLISLACAAVALALFLIFTREREPEYQGRRLSEWLERYRETQSSQDINDSEAAIRIIGTNALPYFLKWIADEPRAWRISVSTNLPAFLDRPPVNRWIEGNASRRSAYALSGFALLATNAVSAIPELEALMKDNTKPMSSKHAIFALSHMGDPAIPVLKSALADTNQLNPGFIIFAFEGMASIRGTNVCWPLLREALSHPNSDVRLMATNAVKGHVPGLLPDAFPQ